MDYDFFNKNIKKTGSKIRPPSMFSNLYEKENPFHTVYLPPDMNWEEREQS